MKVNINTENNIIDIYVEYEGVKVLREAANNKYTNLNREIRRAKKFAKYVYRSKEL